MFIFNIFALLLVTKFYGFKAINNRSTNLIQTTKYPLNEWYHPFNLCLIDNIKTISNKTSLIIHCIKNFQSKNMVFNNISNNRCMLFVNNMYSCFANKHEYYNKVLSELDNPKIKICETIFR